MTDSTEPTAAQSSDVDESAFGVGGQTSAEADRIAADDSKDQSEHADTDEGGGADEEVADSQSADVAAGYDDPTDAPRTDDTFPSIADDGNPAT